MILRLPVDAIVVPSEIVVCPPAMFTVLSTIAPTRFNSESSPDIELKPDKVALLTVRLPVPDKVVLAPLNKTPEPTITSPPVIIFVAFELFDVFILTLPLEIVFVPAKVEPSFKVTSPPDIVFVPVRVALASTLTVPPEISFLPNEVVTVVPSPIVNVPSFWFSVPVNTSLLPRIVKVVPSTAWLIVPSPETLPFIVISAFISIFTPFDSASLDSDIASAAYKTSDPP